MEQELFLIKKYKNKFCQLKTFTYLCKHKSIKTIIMEKQSTREKFLLRTKTENSVETLVQDVVAKDRKFVKRKIENLERDIEDQNELFEQRLASTEPIDESVVEVHFTKISSLQEKIERYKDFSNKYL